MVRVTLAAMLGCGAWTCTASSRLQSLSCMAAKSAQTMRAEKCQPIFDCTHPTAILYFFNACEYSSAQQMCVLMHASCMNPPLSSCHFDEERHRNACAS